MLELLLDNGADITLRGGVAAQRVLAEARSNSGVIVRLQLETLDFEGVGYELNATLSAAVAPRYTSSLRVMRPLLRAWASAFMSVGSLMSGLAATSKSAIRDAEDSSRRAPHVSRRKSV